MEKSKRHIRHCLLYTYQLRKSAAEETRIIFSAVAPNAISVKTAEMWFKRFCSGDYNLGLPLKQIITCDVTSII